MSVLSLALSVSYTSSLEYLPDAKARRHAKICANARRRAKIFAKARRRAKIIATAGGFTAKHYFTGWLGYICILNSSHTTEHILA